METDSFIFKSMTYGDNLTLVDVVDKIQLYFNNMKKYDTPIKIIVGTDSQNFSNTKIVNVIAVICEGHGGIFFYRITRHDKISDVRLKLRTETNESLEITTELVEILEQEKYEELFISCDISIHIDAGRSDKGKTKELIPELVGWIKACGYSCEIKPESYVANSIADKLSK